jgi:hypothetical protein
MGLEYQTMPSLRDVAHPQMDVYEYIIAAGNSQLGSSCQGN